jgi:predicted ATPase
MTAAVPMHELFISRDEMDEELKSKAANEAEEGHSDVNDAMRSLMDDLGMNMKMLKNSSIFSGDEEQFAFARALSRLAEMGSKEWIERGMGLEEQGGQGEKESWSRVRSRWREDFL